MSRVGVIVATAAEAEAVTEHLPGARVAVSGIGAARAAAAAARLAQSDVEGLVSWGTAAGLDPGLATGTVLLPEHIEIDGDTGGRRLPATVDATWQTAVRAALPDTLMVCTGPLLQVDRVLSVRDKATCGTAAGADMESHAIACVAAEHRIPFLALRCVLDTAADELPPAAAAAVDTSGRTKVLPLLVNLSAHPAQWPAFGRLVANFNVVRSVQRDLVKHLTPDLLVTAACTDPP